MPFIALQPDTQFCLPFSFLIVVIRIWGIYDDEV